MNQKRMHKITTISLIIAISCHVGIASAQTPFDARTAPQGSTLEMSIPKHSFHNIKGTFDGETVHFYPISHDPNFDEPISRAEFLELMFTNHNFGTEIDISAIEDFPDVPTNNPYYETIKKAAALGVIHGYEDGLFRPYTTITRGQTAKILVEAFDPPAILEMAPRFTDIPNNHRFFEYVNKAIKAKIFQGYPDGYMRPDRDINFSEAEIVIKRTAIPETFTPLPPKEYFRGFVGIHRLSSTQTKNLDLLLFNGNDESEEQTIPVTITKQNFPTISFSLAEEKTKLFGKDDMNKTWALIDGAKSNPISTQLWEGPFIMPTEGELTLGFGDKLYINGAYAGSHFGLDLANQEGTEIYAPNHGKITLSADTPSYGNTIVIDHGHNIFTMYLHMSELKVEQGDKVEKGDVIGLMGSTGISTGSHLHYTHFVGGTIVDNNEWIEKGF